MSVHPNSLASLRPIKAGEVRNPNGKNQYTYRRDFEATIQRLAEGKYDPRVQENGDDTAKCWYCQLPDCEKLAASLGAVHDECLELVREMTGGELLAHVGFQKALGGDEKYWSEYAARFWLKTEKRELRAVREARAARAAGDSVHRRVGDPLSKDVGGARRAGRRPRA